MSRSGSVVGGEGNLVSLAGLRSPKPSLALYGKMAWRFLHSGNNLWAITLRAKYIRTSLAKRSDPSPMWRCIWKGVNTLGDGELIRFWKDVRVDDKALEEYVDPPIVTGLSVADVASFWDLNRGWKWELFAHLLPLEVIVRIAAFAMVQEGQLQDTLSWSMSPDGNYSVASAYRMLHPAGAECNIDSKCFKEIWKIRA
ncbi:hypothetical protein V2J09_018834 [Rumex salicifolius]